MTRIYLDNCCFNRPYDDQSRLRIELETKSKLFIQKLIVSDNLELIISYMSILENDDNPYEIRKSAICDFFKYAKRTIFESDALLLIAKEINEVGLKPKDSLHIASAIISKCDYFFSTDDKILKYKDSRIVIMNPVNFAISGEGRDS